MRIISRKTLRLFWEKAEYADAEQPLKAWFREASSADWASPAAIKAAFGTASIVANNRVVFNIGGNKYRLVGWINYPYRVVYVRFIGNPPPPNKQPVARAHAKSVERRPGFDRLHGQPSLHLQLGHVCSDSRAPR